LETPRGHFHAFLAKAGVEIPALDATEVERPATPSSVVGGGGGSGGDSPPIVRSTVARRERSDAILEEDDLGECNDGEENDPSKTIADGIATALATKMVVRE
jgi:hypothetical protein